MSKPSTGPGSYDALGKAVYGYYRDEGGMDTYELQKLAGTYTETDRSKLIALIAKRYTPKPTSGRRDLIYRPPPVDWSAGETQPSSGANAVPVSVVSPSSGETETNATNTTNATNATNAASAASVATGPGTKCRRSYYSHYRKVEKEETTQSPSPSDKTQPYKRVDIHNSKGVEIIDDETGHHERELSKDEVEQELARLTLNKGSRLLHWNNWHC